MREFLRRLAAKIEEWLTGRPRQIPDAARRSLEYDQYIRVNRQPPAKTATESSD